MLAGLPSAALLQLDQAAARDTHCVLHPQHGGPRPLLGLVCLSQVREGGERGLQGGNIGDSLARQETVSVRISLYIIGV